MPNPNDVYDNIEVGEIAKEIGEDLFPKNPSVSTDPDTLDNEPVVQETKALVKPENTDPLSPNPRVEPGLNRESTPLPKSWKKDMEPVWQKADPALHAYVMEREAQVMRGIQQYQGGYKAWDTLIKPFAPLLEQNPDVNPVHLLQGLMNTHLQLLNPNAQPAQKAALVQQLLQEYGISLDGSTPQPQDQRLMQELQTLRTELQNVKQYQTRSQQQQYEAGVSQHQQTIEQFSKDPKNKYFEEVGNDILRLIQTGAATDLPSAYEQACWLNPTVRAKMLAEQQVTEKSNNQGKPRKPNGQFVNLDEVPPQARQKRGSIDDTIDAVVASHYTKH